MKRNSFQPLFLAICFATTFTVSAQEQEVEMRVRLADLPPAVRVTVEQQRKGARIRELSKEIEKGQTFYEVSLLARGRIKDVLMNETGGIVEIEEQVTLASLPAPAREEILKQAAHGKITVIESISRDNAIVAYEAHVRKAGKLQEIKVTPEGKPFVD